MKNIVYMSLFLSVQCMAGIYQWKDDKGAIHYSDKKSQSEKIEEVALRESNVLMLRQHIKVIPVKV